MVGVPFDPRDPRFRALPRTMRTMAPQAPQGLPPPPPPVDNATQQLPPPLDMPPSYPPNPNATQQLPPPGSGMPLQSPVAPAPVEPPTTVAPEGDEKWTAKTKTDTFGSFFNKRSSTDALTAFGAAMLKAPTFMQGLGDAALAVNAVDRENRMPTEEEIARANIKARMASGKGAYAPKPIGSGYDGNNEFWTGAYSSDGSEIWRSESGATLDHAPPQFVRAQDSGLSQRGKDNHKYQTAARDRADLAQQNMSTYDSILETAPHANVGSGLLEKGARGLASLAGMDIGDDQNLADTQVFTKNMRKLELQVAQSQKGLGQFTEMERKIVSEALPSLDTQAATVFRVTVQMKLRDQLDTELYNDYMDMPESRRPSFEEYAYDKRKEQKAEYEGRYKDLIAQELAAYPEYQKYMKTKSDKAEPSILDEADAIVN